MGKGKAARSLHQSLTGGFKGIHVPAYPETISFYVLREEVGEPTITIKPDGRLKPRNPSFNVPQVNVLLEMRGEGIHVTAAQYRSMVQLARIVLHRQPLATIIFNAAASPWELDYLPDYHEKWTTTAEAMRMRPTRIKKVWLRKKPLHPVIRQRKAEAGRRLR